MVGLTCAINRLVLKSASDLKTVLGSSGFKYHFGAIGCIAKRNMVTLETLQFDNLALRTLPLDPTKENYVRQVNNSCFSLVEPSPVDNPTLVAHSQSAMDLLDLGEQEVHRTEFDEYFSGNKKLPGSTTAAHCYCGHQFGTFAGQLGDGAAMYLGEVVNAKSERWEIQLKGAGKTPYSRSADGRKVLRSSIREFLCSEAMHYLGIPTTRAGSCITSDTKVIRDIFYDGNPIYEKSTVVLRIAPTFIRFGSFEIFKNMDMLTGRRGPSAGKTDILVKLLEYVIETFYPNIKSKHCDNAEDRYLAFYKEIVSRTAKTVALWQCVGFCHGVLNTDNMSIVGLTIDYGPFGFMDHYNSCHVCNASDDMARYSYREQPYVCQWNLLKLAEALHEVLPLSKSKEILYNTYDETFLKSYKEKMRKKLGIVNIKAPEDKKLFDSLLITMEKTDADFTNTFRCLSRFQINATPDVTSGNEELLEYILSQCLVPSDIPEEQSSRELQLMMTSRFELFQQHPLVAAERKRIERTRKLRETSPLEKRRKDEELWINWLLSYRERIMKELDGVTDTVLANNTRISIMNENNPSFILRNYIAESAIQAAEKGDYTLVREVLTMLQSPYSERQHENEGSPGMDIPTMSCKDFGTKTPKWGREIRVT